MQFQIIQAKKEDTHRIASLIAKVWDEMEQKEWYVADNAEYTREVLESGQGMGFLAIEEETEELAGILLVIFPGDSTENLGLEAGLTDQLDKVAHMDSAAVLSKYRGHQLQYRLMQKAEEQVVKLGYQYLMCTVHPENRYSLANVQKQGYDIVTTKEKYGGYLRCILIKHCR